MLKCPNCEQMTLGRNGWYPNAAHADRAQRRRCRNCGHTSIDGVADGPGRKPIGPKPMTNAEHVAKSRKKIALPRTVRSGSYFYVLCTDNTKEGTIGLVKGNRKAIALEHPGKRVRLLSGYPAGMRRWIWGKFGGDLL